jgi:hemerythrin-like domain-containing protein
MPIVIGGKPESDFTDPIGMLGDCHRRIVGFLHVLVRLAAPERDGSLSSEERTLLSTSLRYFRESAPKHTADEEESLFPRLRGIESSDVDSVLARIESLEQDHECADRNHAEIDRLGQLWLVQECLTAQEASQFRALTDQLERLYRHHIGIEENEVFPFAARALSPEERRTIGVEMAARRGIGTAVLSSSQGESAEAR